jgi:ribosomal-protein-alanine N-acetyltransferase
MEYLLHEQTSERLLFRPIEKTDWDSWLPFFKSPMAMKHWPIGNLSVEEYAKEWYKKQWNRYQQGWGGMNALIEKERGKLIGHAGLLTQKIEGQLELEIAYSILPQYWKKGYATEAAIKCKEFAFQKKNVKRLISIIASTNEKSKAVALRTGLTFEKETQFQGIKVNIFSLELE